MATVVRLKRKRTDDPIENLCVDLKRSKPNEENSRILKLVATVDSKEEFSVEKTLTLLEESRKKRSSVPSTLQTPANISRKRQLQITGSDSVTSSIKRTSTSSSDNSLVQIYDLESMPVDPLWSSGNSSKDVISCNGEPLVSEDSASQTANSTDKSEDYVYDLFFIDPAAGEGFSHQWLEEALLYEAFEEGYDEFGNEYREQKDDSSDDSNAEDNWRNDYPDEECSGEEDGERDEYSSSGHNATGGDNAVNNLFDGGLKIASDEDLDGLDSIDDASFEIYYNSYKRQYGFHPRNPSTHLVDELDSDDDSST